MIFQKGIIILLYFLLKMLTGNSYWCCYSVFLPSFSLSTQYQGKRKCELWLWAYLISFGVSSPQLAARFVLCDWYFDTPLLAAGSFIPVSRGVMLTGKFLGTVIILTMFVVMGIVVSILILLFSGQTMITYATVAEIGGFLLLSFLLIACASAIGLLTSVLSYYANTSLLIGLMVWLILLFVIPHTTLLLSNKLFPVESSDVITQNTNNSRKIIEASFPEGKWHSEGNNPFTSDHQIRANMQMEFMLGEKKIRDDWYNSQFSQYVNASKMTLISPMFIFEMGNEQMLNGGFQRFKNNWDDLHTYQGQFLVWFKAFDAKDPKSPHWYNPYEDYSTSKSKINIDEVPVYSESIVPFAQRISQSGIYIALLLVYTAILFYISFVLFVRYDVR